MRKQDRVAAQHQGSREPSPRDTGKSERPQSEQMKGSESMNEPARHPERHGGRMPLPD
jgi:hypothetical protein